MILREISIVKSTFFTHSRDFFSESINADYAFAPNEPRVIFRRSIIANLFFQKAIPEK